MADLSQDTSSTPEDPYDAILRMRLGGSDPFGSKSSAAVQAATGTAPLDAATQATLGSGPASPAVQAATGSAPADAATQAALGSTTAPIPPAGTGITSPTDSTTATTPPVTPRGVNDVPPPSTGIVPPPTGSSPIDATNAANQPPPPPPTATTTPPAPPPATTTTPPPTTTATGTTPTDTGASKVTLPPGVPLGSSLFSQNDAKTETGYQYPDGTIHWFGLDGKEVAAPADKTGSGPTSGTVNPVESGSDLVATASQSLNDIMTQAQQIAGSSPEVGVLFTQQLQSILAMIDGEEKKLRDEYDAQGTTMDPATQFNLDTLRKQLTEGIQKNNEDLNSRGLYNSGIAMDLQQKLQTGEMSGEAQVLAARFDKLQTQLASGLQALSGERITSARDLGLAGANAQSSADENTINRRTAAAQQLLGFRNQAQGQLSSQRFNAVMQAQSLAAEAQRQQADFVAQEQRLQEQLNAAAQQGDANRAADLQKQILDIRAAADRAAADNAAAMARVQAQEAGANARASNNGTTNTGGGQKVADAVADLQNTYSNREDANAAILNNIAALTSTIGSAGIAALQAAANALPPKSSVSAGDPAGMR